MKSLLLAPLFLFALSSVTAHATEELRLNLADICDDANARETAFCKSLQTLVDSGAELKPVEIKHWKFRVILGFTRTHYNSTDVKIKSTPLTTTLKGFKFDERTSDKYFNPTKWEHLSDATKWIDEPSNKITLIAQKGRDIFYISLFHPKALGAIYEKKEIIDGEEVVTYIPAEYHISDGTPEAFAAIPAGHSAFELQNTHKFFTLSVGYGREMTIASGKVGKLSYTPSVDVGLSFGSLRSIYISPDMQWSENREPFGPQGYLVSGGHRLEYQRGKISLFVEQRMNFGHQSSEFLDGTADYNFNYHTVTAGIGIDLWNPAKRKKKLKARAARY